MNFCVCGGYLPLGETRCRGCRSSLALYKVDGTPLWVMPHQLRWLKVMSA